MKPSKSSLCAYRQLNGRACQAFHMRGQDYCYFHRHQKDKVPQKLHLPVLDCHEAVYKFTQDVRWALLIGQISQKTANLLLWAASVSDKLVSQMEQEENSMPPPNLIK